MGGSSSPGRASNTNSFLEYVMGQNAKKGHGMDALDAAMGMPPSSAPAPSEAAAPQQIAMEAPTASSPPMTMGGPELIQQQQRGLQLTDQDRFYRRYGHLPTAGELATSAFATDFKTRQGRYPTKQETIAHLYRRPEVLLQVSKDYKEI